MNEEYIVDVDNLTIRFNMASEKVDNLKEYVIKLIKHELMFQEFLALKDVNLKVKRGEAWGLIGTNGSGKSTLLKACCGILKPYKGSVTTKGTIAPLIIKLLRDAGATEVHFMVSAPPFKYPCYFGTDIPDQKLLVATGRTVEQINEVIGADTLGYLSTEHVVQLAKNAKCGFCTACFTGEYAVKPDEVLSTDIHERHLNDRPKDEKKLGE